MNYKESKLILEKIKKAKRILINCHRGPDPDSIGSALSLYKVLGNFGKEVEIVCPSDEIGEDLNYLSDYKVIKKKVNFISIDYSKFDMFFTLDSSNWEMVTGFVGIERPNLTIIVADHHDTNTYYGDINLVDKKATSTCELLYLLFKDWNIDIERTVANYLMVGIVGDTGSFRFPGSTHRIFEIATDLMEKGADKDEIVHHLFGSQPFELIKFYGEVLTRARIDKKGRFVWSAVPYEIYEKLSKPASARESSAMLFAQVVKDTDFGFIAVEGEKDILSVSFRSRTGFDTSKIALSLGGGGHRYASACKIKGLPFDEAVQKVLETARKFAREKRSK